MVKFINKLLTVGIIFLLIGINVPSTGTNIEEVFTISFNGNTLNVGGSGEGNYSSIQDAIDNASDGDTVFVYNGTYIENLIINKSIKLIGENRNKTVIDGIGNQNAVYISSDWVTLNELTVTNGGIKGIVIASNYTSIIGNNIISNIVYGMVILYSDKNEITDNKILNNQAGLSLLKSNNNFVTNNLISNSWGSGITLIDSNNNTIKSNNCNSNTYACGIGLRFSNNTTVIHNTISNNSNGITISCSNLNTIASNNISSNKIHGIELYFSNNNTVTVNNITSNRQNGICIDSSNNNNTIYHNNLISNSQNANDEGNNIWDNGYPSGGNYWDNYKGNDVDEDDIGDLPYNVPGGVNQDNYPLMKLYGITKLSMFIGKGLFKFSGNIKNIGNKTAFNVQWRITIDGGKFILGRNSSGIIPKPLLPNEVVSVNSKIFLGYGPVIITVELWADNAPYISEKIYGFLFFFFLMIH